MTTISKTDLENARRDAQDLGLIVNGTVDINGTGLVPTRTGGSAKTIAKLESEFQEKIDDQTVEEEAATAAAAEAVAAAAAIPAFAAAPIDLTGYGLPEQIHNNSLVSPTANITISGDNEQITLAAANGRLFFRTDESLYIPRFAPGDTVSIWCRVASGEAASATVTFYTAADAAIGAALNLVKVGPWLVYTGVVPALGDYIRLDISNAGKANPLVITRPRLATKDVIDDGLPNQKSLAFDAIRANFGLPEGIQNLWPAAPMLSKVTGTGPVPIINGDGSYTCYAEAIAAFRKFGTNYAPGTKLTFLAHVAEGNQRVRSVVIRYQLTSGTVVNPLRQLGDGWYYGVITVNPAATSNATDFWLEVDNRTLLTSYYTAADCIIDKVVMMEGDVMPAQIPSDVSVSASSYDPAEIVVIAAATQIDVFVKGSKPTSAKYLRYRMTRQDLISAMNSDVWRWSLVTECERTGDATFVEGINLTTTGEQEMAIRLNDKPETIPFQTDAFGGAAHGNELHVSGVFFIDGVKQALGSVGTFRCTRFEMVQESNAMEPSPASGTPIAAKSYKRWEIARGELVLTQHLIWQATYNLRQCYHAMLSWLRTNGAVVVSDTGYRAPLFLPEDIAAAGFVEIGSTADNAKASGAGGYSAEIQMLEGWTHAQRRFNFSPSAAYNKFYFWTVPNGTVVNSGDIFRTKARYILDTRN